MPTKKVPAKEKRQKLPESLRLASLAPSFTVSDVGKSVAWYRDVLGFIVAQEWKTDNGKLAGVRLKAGAVTLMLNQDDFAKGRDRVKGVGFRLYCFTRQDVDARAAQVKSHGGKLDSEPHAESWGARVFRLSDPDGYHLTIGSWDPLKS
jgi:uncharacterized glyoxalase superfamily protein PhnB